MDRKLIIVNGKDKTDSIVSCNREGGKTNIVFASSPRVYSYNNEKVRILEVKQKIDPRTVIFRANGHTYMNLKTILDYGSFVRVEFPGGKYRSFEKRAVQIDKNCLADQRCEELFSYFRDVATAISLKTESDRNILGVQYEKIQGVEDSTVLATFLDPKMAIRRYAHESLIYPFGLNQSQKTAVENAFSSQVSIIQGPPGTGKTQTILNIVANAVRKGKTVAVVSNNNSAILNVVEKLEKQGLSFLTAMLGSTQNKENFLARQTGKYPDMSDWGLSSREEEELKNEVQRLTEELNDRLNDRNRIAAVEKELLQLKPEQFYFKEYYETHKPQVELNQSAFRAMSSKKLVSLWIEYEDAAEKGKLGFLQKIWIAFRFSRAGLRLFKQVPQEAIPFVQNVYYQVKQQELQAEKASLERRLVEYRFDEKMADLSRKSMQLFKAELARQCTWQSSRLVFQMEDFHVAAERVNREYPVILSTTYSIKGSLSVDHMYDYLIVDEASQVDLATGVLAFACAKNIVIVGDQKQLPNVVSPEDARMADKFWAQHDFDERYRFTTHSLLRAAVEIWQDAPSVLLREHYRCHPKIAEFFNQKFYGGELIVMSEDKGEKHVLAMYRTAPGNHARGHVNRRQLDVIEQEVLPALKEQGYEDIGIITPYTDQVAALKQELGESYDIATVHKFQGREKEAIILTTVDNTIGKFVDKPCMLNVAVSRAVRSLSVVISNDKENEKTNYGDLAKYIEYNNFQIIDSRVFSVFDLLYQARYAQRQAFLKAKGRISEYDSENLAYTVIEKILHCEEFSALGCAAQVSLATLVKAQSLLSEQEREYAKNPLTRLDFLIFNRMDRSPILAIEIDGTAFHQAGSRQAERDCMKNSVLHKIGLPLLRIRTDESGEEAKIAGAIRKSMSRETR